MHLICFSDEPITACHENQPQRNIEKSEPHKRKKCQFCTVSFKDNNDLALHVRMSHMMQNEKQEFDFYCYDCGDRFSEAGFVQHTELLHGLVSKNKCSFCNTQFNFPSELNSHHKTAHKNTSCTFDDCKKIFGNFGSLFVHYTNSHKMKETLVHEKIETAKTGFVLPSMSTEPSMISGKSKEKSPKKQHNKEKNNNNLMANNEKVAKPETKAKKKETSKNLKKSIENEGKLSLKKLPSLKSVKKRKNSGRTTPNLQPEKLTNTETKKNLAQKLKGPTKVKKNKQGCFVCPKPKCGYSSGDR